MNKVLKIVLIPFFCIMFQNYSIDASEEKTTDTRSISPVLSKDDDQALLKAFQGGLNLYQVNAVGDNLLHQAVRFQAVKCIKLLLEKETSSFYASHNSQQNSLLVNAVNFKGQTPLLIATKQKKYALLKSLLAAGADVNQADNNGWTSLHEIVDNDYDQHEKTIPLLLSAGANVDQVDKEGVSPLVYAGRYRPELVVPLVVGNKNDVQDFIEEHEDNAIVNFKITQKPQSESCCSIS